MSQTQKKKKKKKKYSNHRDNARKWLAMPSDLSCVVCASSITSPAAVVPESCLGQGGGPAFLFAQPTPMTSAENGPGTQIQRIITE